MDGVNFYIRKVYNIKYSIFWISKIKNMICQIKLE